MQVGLGELVELVGVALGNIFDGITLKPGTCVGRPHQVIQVRRTRSSLTDFTNKLVCYWVSIHIFLKVTFLLCSIWKDHSANSVLNTSDPLALVHTAVRPDHLSVTLALVINIISFINVSTSPGEYAFAMLSVIIKVTIIYIETLIVS